jgi:hypothetical protein
LENSRVPEVQAGWIAAATFGVAIVLTSLLAQFLEIRDGRKRDLEERVTADIEVR